MVLDLLKDLNKEQQNAVIATDGSVIILAGAGSGKTRVLTYRVLYLMLEKYIDPSHILMVTFTNKAASEMKERMQKMTQGMNMPTVATFHSLCSKILRREARNIGMTADFVIYDTSDQEDAIKQTMELLGLSLKEYKPRSLLEMISSAKNEMLTSSEYSDLARGHFQQVAAIVYSAYQKLLKANNAFDFDDLLLQVVSLFRDRSDILKKYQEQFQYILIDEYQDTNKVQYTLTKLLSGPLQNVCVVGDFSQSIYSWRGADFTNLSRFKTDFKNVKVFELSQNYRSTQNILDAAVSVIQHNTTHPVLSLWTKNGIGEEIHVRETRNEQEEILQIIEFIQNYNKNHLSDIAILYRTNAQSRIAEEMLLHHGIPYVLVGGTRFYERKEIKDVLSYLRLFLNPKDSVSLKRVEKLGKTRFLKFQVFQEQWLQKKDFVTIDLLDNCLAATGYLALYDEEDEEDTQRLENIKELRSVAINFPDLVNFLENVSLVEQEYMPDKPIDGQKNAITLMTLHAAKGLEFPVVFMIGMEEGLFPHSRALMDKNELEEERRLCYVGMTRAREKLFLSYTRKRLYFGQRNSNVISRFLLELPEDIIKSQIKSSEFKDSDLDYPDYL
ncbi:MAG TPA: UvrD-helicase domain-containing protein [Patescibacteria group bacterium]|nr:UvrD-helicase domain-containing protein [Patescibacteria group bacterium]